MKNIFRASVLTCATFCLFFTLSVSSASGADHSGDIVRAAQMRLAELGYYVGRYDGLMGPLTKTALINFQRHSGLAVTGQLTPDTYSLLTRQDYAMSYSDDYAVQPQYQDVYKDMMPISVVWDNRWHDVHTQSVPTRFARLEVTEDDRGSLRHYTVTLNGHPVLIANNQPQILRVSNTYTLDHEDAVVFTTYHGDGACAYKNYLLTVRGDGSYNRPQEIGNCTSQYEAHVADNSLVISFPTNNVVNGFGAWDTWLYKDNALVRL